MAGAAWCAASPVAPHAFLGSHCSSCSVFGENRQAVTGQCSHPAGIQDDLRHPYPTKPQLNSAPRLPGEHNPRRDTATPLRCPGARALLSATHSHVLGIAADDSTLLARKSGLFFSPRPVVDTVRADFGYPQLSPHHASLCSLPGGSGVARRSLHGPAVSLCRWGGIWLALYGSDSTSLENSPKIPNRASRRVTLPEVLSCS